VTIVFWVTNKGKSSEIMGDKIFSTSSLDGGLASLAEPEADTE
jgi:hypothetical protein